MYLLLCGVPPFIGHTEKEIMSKIVNEPLVFRGKNGIKKMEFGRNGVQKQSSC